MKKIGSCALLCALLLSFLSGCAAETFTEEHYAADPAQISQIQLDLRDRQVEVIASTDGQIHLRYSQSDSEFYRIAEKDGVLTMTSESNRKWYQYFGWKTNKTHRIVVLELPPERLLARHLHHKRRHPRIHPIRIQWHKPIRQRREHRL